MSINWVSGKYFYLVSFLTVGFHWVCREYPSLIPFIEACRESLSFIETCPEYYTKIYFWGCFSIIVVDLMALAWFYFEVTKSKATSSFGKTLEIY